MRARFQLITLQCYVLPDYIRAIIFPANANLNNRYIDLFMQEYVVSHYGEKLKVRWHIVCMFLNDSIFYFAFFFIQRVVFYFFVIC